MARTSRGRKPAKNETAAALLNALAFIGNLKTPPAGSPAQYGYVFLNQGYAIGFDGVVAAGHPIPGDIAGYPHAKLLAEALEHTDKTFSMTRRDDGAFEIGSDKYTAIVPVMDPREVIPTFPDNKQGPITDPASFLAALKVTQEITTDTGTTAAYSAVKVDGATFMATDGRIALEVRHGNNLPPVTLPRQFVTAVLKSGKTPEAIGINGADWSTLTLWFTDGAWLRTNLYGADVFSGEMSAKFRALIDGVNGYEKTEIPPKLWATVKAVLPFAVDNLVMLRPGIVRTHAKPHEGAALQLDKLNMSIDLDGKSLLTLIGLATAFAVGETEGAYVLAFSGGGVEGIPPLRGVVQGDFPVPTDEGASGGWGTAQTPAQAAEGWGMASNVAPPPEDAPSRREAAPQSEWKGGPAEGLANDPEFLSQYHNEPVENFTVPVEDAYIFEGTDNGISLKFSPEVETGAFQASAWLTTLTDDDAGLKE